MIELKNASFFYGQRKIIDKAQLRLCEGELCALIGQNGCGKTTLLRLISGLCRPESGELLLDGKSYEKYKRKEFAAKLSFLPQTPPDIKMNVYDYIAYGRYPYTGISFCLTDRDRAAIEGAVDDTGVGKLLSRDISELSGGERRLVCLARVIAQDTPYILLDEPTAFADVKNSFLISDIMADQAKKGKCVLAVMHDIALAMSTFPRIAVMHEGKIISDGTAEQTAANKAVERAFGVTCEKTDRGYVLNKMS